MATNPFASLDSRRACQAASGFALRARPGTLLAHGRLLRLEGLFKALNETLYPERGRGSKDLALRSKALVFAGEGEWPSNSQPLAKPHSPSPNPSRKGRGIRSRPFLWFRIIGTDSHRHGGDRPPS